MRGRGSSEASSACEWVSTLLWALDDTFDIYGAVVGRLSARVGTAIWAGSEILAALILIWVFCWLAKRP